MRNHVTGKGWLKAITLDFPAMFFKPPSHTNFFDLFYLLAKCEYMHSIVLATESCFRHPLFDLLGTREVEIRHTNFHFSSKKVTSKSRKVEK